MEEGGWRKEEREGGGRSLRKEGEEVGWGEGEGGGGGRREEGEGEGGKRKEKRKMTKR